MTLTEGLRITVPLTCSEKPAPSVIDENTYRNAKTNSETGSEYWPYIAGNIKLKCPFTRYSPMWLRAFDDRWNIMDETKPDELLLRTDSKTHTNYTIIQLQGHDMTITDPDSGLPTCQSPALRANEKLCDRSSTRYHCLAWDKDQGFLVSQSAIVRILLSKYLVAVFNIFLYEAIIPIDHLLQILYISATAVD